MAEEDLSGYCFSFCWVSSWEASFSKRYKGKNDDKPSILIMNRIFSSKIYLNPTTIIEIYNKVLLTKQGIAGLSFMRICTTSDDSMECYRTIKYFYSILTMCFICI